MTWKKVKLGEVIKQRKGFINIDNEVEYKLCRVQVHRKGVVLREYLKGFQINTKKQQVCKAGDFIVAEMDAKVGGYGFIPNELDGAIVSSHYFLFELDTKKIRPQFLEVVSQLKILQEQIKAIGSTNYAAIRPANVLDWEIPFPPIEKQIEIERVFKNAKFNVDKLQQHYQFQLTQIEHLNQAILQEAVQGKLVAQNPADEPATKLLQRIKAEKAVTLRLSKGGKKEKNSPPIKPEEIPFEIPESWVWCRLGEVCEVKRGKSPKYSEKGVFKMLNQKCVRWYSIELQHCKSIDKDWFMSVSEDYLVKENDVLVNSTGDGTIGRSAIAHKEVEGYAFDTHILKITSNINQNYICYYINSNYGQEQVNKSKGATSTKQHELGVNNLSNFTIPLPPLSEQKRIVAEIEKQLAKTQQLKQHIIANQQATEQLLKALLHQAFEVGEQNTASANIQETKEELAIAAEPQATYQTAKVVEFKPTYVDYYRRSVLAAEIVWQLHQEPTLGHLKLQKLIYLCQKTANMQLPTNFLRQAMGPYDNRLMRSIDKQLKEKKWFNYQKEQVLKYQPLERAGQHHNDFIKYFSKEKESIQYLLDTYRKTKSDNIEIHATLYACMDNMLYENVIFSKKLLIERFYEWSEEKKKYNEVQLKEALIKMTESGIIPKAFSF